MITAAPTTSGALTARGSSYAMQLYNTSRPVLEGYPFGMTVAEYEQAVVRYFREGRAVGMFAYADAGGRRRWESLGFKLDHMLDIVQPNGQHIGYYVFA